MAKKGKKEMSTKGGFGKAKSPKEGFVKTPMVSPKSMKGK